MTEQEFIEWYDSENKEYDLPTYLLRDMSIGMFGELCATEHGENRRWSRRNTTYFKISNRYFAIEWEEGLTEYQDNEYYEAPYEVVKHEYEKTIQVVEWKRI